MIGMLVNAPLTPAAVSAKDMIRYLTTTKAALEPRWSTYTPGHSTFHVPQNIFENVIRLSNIIDTYSEATYNHDLFWNYILRYILRDLKC
jgi:hypothetical protein